MTAYSPRLAWLRATVYFAACLAASAGLGVFQRVLESPAMLSSQLADPQWWIATSVVTAYTVFAYLYFWPLGTVAHGRPRRILAGAVFGLLWGFCQGQLMLVVFELLARRGLPIAATVGLTFLAWSAFAALWQSRYWDIKVSPEHNIESWNLRKVLVAHMPFLLLCLAHYATYGNTRLFLAWQILALTASSLAMRFPAPTDEPIDD
jgi:hypothetical protein